MGVCQFILVYIIVVLIKSSVVVMRIFFSEGRYLNNMFVQQCRQDLRRVVKDSTAT